MTILIISGCSTDEVSRKEGSKEEAAQSSEPIEPSTDTVCAFCQMEVYHKDHKMGVFTAQGVTKDGEFLFFDDSGCILNYERKTGEELSQKWVRDYITTEWIESDSATPVHSAITSPMKYGYSFYKSEEDAEKFIKEEPALTPAITSWKTIDEVANQRYQKKMQMQKEQNSDQ